MAGGKRHRGRRIKRVSEVRLGRPKGSKTGPQLDTFTREIIHDVVSQLPILPKGFQSILAKKYDVSRALISSIVSIESKRYGVTPKGKIIVRRRRTHPAGNVVRSQKRKRAA